MNNNNNNEEKLKRINENVKKLLEKYPQFRKLRYRRELIWLYWKNFDGLSFGITKELWLYRLTNPETISRAIRKCQEQNPELRPDKEEQTERYVQADIFRGFYKRRKV